MEEGVLQTEEDVLQIRVDLDSEVEEMVNCFVLPLFGEAILLKMKKYGKERISSN